MIKIPAGRLGGGFYLAAAVYLGATKPPDLITVTAVLCCLALAVLSATRYKDWAVIGGGLLIACSLLLQSVLSYRCLDCLRADLIILAGVISLAVPEQGRYKKVLRFLAFALTASMALTVALHFDPAAIAGRAVFAEEAEAAPCPEGCQDAAGTAGGTSMGVIAPDQKPLSLDLALKPALFFSPKCSACIRAVEALAGADPGGNRWVPVQAYGDPAEGVKLLKEKGYRGEYYTYPGHWRGPVPVLAAAGKNGRVQKTSSLAEMLRLIGGVVD